MKKNRNRYLIIVLVSIAGLLGGYLYWRFIGCRNGSCPITSNWYTSSLMGGLIGFLAGDTAMDLRKKKHTGNEGSLE